MFEFINRNLLLLFGCQMVFVAGNILLVTVGGIVGYQLAPDPAFATLPVALMVIGTACATVPAAFTMQRIGRKYGFILATGIAALGAWLATVARMKPYLRPMRCMVKAAGTVAQAVPMTINATGKVANAGSGVS